MKTEFQENNSPFQNILGFNFFVANFLINSLIMEIIGPLIRVSQRQILPT